MAEQNITQVHYNCIPQIKAIDADLAIAVWLYA